MNLMYNYFMRYLLLGFIKVYQMIPGSWHNNCRHIPTCSNYAIDSIITYGSFKGSILAIKRIIKCNPFGNAGYDPIPERRKK